MQNSRHSARPRTLGSDFHKQPLNPSVLLTVPVSGSHSAARTENRITVLWAEPRLISPSCAIGMLAVQSSKIASFQEVTCSHSLIWWWPPPSAFQAAGWRCLYCRRVGEESRILAAIYLAIPAAGFMLLCSTLTLSFWFILDIVCWLPWKRGYRMPPPPMPRLTSLPLPFSRWLCSNFCFSWYSGLCYHWVSHIRYS